MSGDIAEGVTPSLLKGERVGTPVDDGGTTVAVVSGDTAAEASPSVECGTEDKDAVFEGFRRIASTYRHQSNEIATTLAEETGYPFSDCIELIEVVITYLNNVDEHYEKVFGDERQFSFDQSIGYRRRITTRPTPEGHIFLLTPANATIPVAPLNVVSALVTGNGVTVRPSMSTPQSARAALEPFVDEFPGRINLAFMDVSEIYESSFLSTVDVFHYTGSSKHYPRVVEAAANAAANVYVEGAGQGIFVVENYPKRAAKSLRSSLVRCNGALCTSPSGVYVNTDIAEEFWSALESELQTVKVGDPLDPAVELAADTYVPDLDEQVRFEHESGRLRVYKTNGLPEDGLVGPAVWYDEWSNRSDVFELLAERDLGLTTTIFTSNERPFLRGTAENSRLCFNGDPTLQSPFSPWGAMKWSGESPGNTFLEKFTRDVIVTREPSSTHNDAVSVVEWSREGTPVERRVPRELGAKDAPNDGLCVENYWSGVSATDRAAARGSVRFARPRVPGSQNVSRVVSGTAMDVRGAEVTPGDVLVWAGHAPCGNCLTCRDGRPHECIAENVNGLTKSSTLPPHSFGGWAEYSYVDPDTLFVRIDEANARPLFTLAEPIALLERVVDPVGISPVLVGDPVFTRVAATYFRLRGGQPLLVTDHPIKQSSHSSDVRTCSVEEWRKTDPEQSGIVEAGWPFDQSDYFDPDGQTVRLRPHWSRSQVENDSDVVVEYDSSDIGQAVDLLENKGDAFEDLLSIFSVAEVNAAIQSPQKSILDVQKWEPSS